VQTTYCNNTVFPVFRSRRWFELLKFLRQFDRTKVWLSEKASKILLPRERDFNLVIRTPPPLATDAQEWKLSSTGTQIGINKDQLLLTNTRDALHHGEYAANK